MKFRIIETKEGRFLPQRSTFMSGWVPAIHNPNSMTYETYPTLEKAKEELKTQYAPYEPKVVWEGELNT